jgi:membrane-bound ClpP family serine protease
MESGPRSALALSGTIVGAIAVVLLLLTVGVGFFITGVMGIVSIMLGLLARQQIRQAGTGRAGQARAAIWIGSIALGLSIVAFIVWTALDASGFQPDDLQRWLEDRLEEERARSS